MVRHQFSNVLVFLIICFVLAGCGSSQDTASTAMNYSGNSSSAEQADRANAPSMRPPSKASTDHMIFQDYGTNPFISTEDDTLSTFAVDVDTGSYTLTRSYLELGELPPAEAVRLEEFVNYFDLQYVPPKDEPFAIHIDGGPAPFGEDHYQLVRIGVKGKEIDNDEREQANLTFVIDVSGSMNRDNRIDLVKDSLLMLVEQLRDDDQVGIVVYGSTAHVVLEPTPAKHRKAILDAIDSLDIEGATNAEEGLMLGYKMASDMFDRHAINRIILCSDGVANVGETGPEAILEKVVDYSEQGIHLSTFGFGMGNYNDVLMEQLADKGDGTYAYIDHEREASRVFVKGLTGTLQTIAKDVKIQVEFDPEVVDRYRLLGYENREVADEDFRNDRVDGGEIGAGHTVTALYEIRLKQEHVPIGEVRLRYKDPAQRDEAKEINRSINVEGDLSTETLFLAAVAEFAEIMRDSYWAEEGSLDEVYRLAKQTASGDDQKEFIHLIEQVIDYK